MYYDTAKLTLLPLQTLVHSILQCLDIPIIASLHSVFHRNKQIKFYCYKIGTVT